jgi:hypothetical protein
MYRLDDNYKTCVILKDIFNMSANSTKPHLPFYLLWILLTLLCIPIAFFLDLAILRIIIHFVGDVILVDGTRRITEDYLGIYTFIPIVSLLTGVVQYLLLRRYLAHMGWWVVATIGGWLVGMSLTLIPGWFHWTTSWSHLDLAFVIMGSSIGVWQWLVLKRCLPRAGWWIGANVAGWGLVALITEGNSLGQFGLLAFGLSPACVTALMLALLIRQVRPTELQGA